MTLDSPRNWRHAEQLERGDVPMIPEVEAAARIGSLLGRYISPAWFTDAAMQMIGSKAVAHRMVLRSIFDDLDSDEKRIPERDVVLRQQSIAQLEDPDYWAEHVHHLRRELADAEAIYARVCQRQVAEYDPDEVAADRADDRARVQRQSDAAREQAPKVAS